MSAALLANRRLFTAAMRFVDFVRVWLLCAVRTQAIKDAGIRVIILSAFTFDVPEIVMEAAKLGMVRRVFILAPLALRLTHCHWVALRYRQCV